MGILRPKFEKSYCHIWNQDLQSLMQKQKSVNVGPKLPYLDIFELKFEKIIFIFKIITIEFIKNDFLTNAVNLGLGSAFSEGPGADVGPSLVYKVCPFFFGTVFFFQTKLDVCLLPFGRFKNYWVFFFLEKNYVQKHLPTIFFSFYNVSLHCRKFFGTGAEVFAVLKLW